MGSLGFLRLRCTDTPRSGSYFIHADLSPLVVLPTYGAFAQITTARQCLAAESRGTAKVAYDGRGSTELRAGDFVEVCESPHPFALRVS